MSYCVLIPAKSYSSRLPGKNFMKFNGKPLIKWTIEFAKKLKYPIYVSTDLHDYKYPGVITIVRPQFLKEMDMEIVVEHASKKIKEDIIILLQPTSPIRKVQDLRNIIAIFETCHKNLVTVNKYTLTPNGYYFVFPKNKYIWNHDVYYYQMEPSPDIDYIWDFRIAEAMQRGDYD